MRHAEDVTRPRSDPGTGFRHEALFYAGLDDFVESTSKFIRDAIEADEPILVVVDAEKIQLLRDELGRDARFVEFADMREVGHNPARIIPAWYDFHAGRAVDGRYIRGIGEPISARLSADALVECQRHESLLNLAFAEASDWWLLCPYDTTALAPDVVDEALRSHPHVLEDGAHRDSASCRDLASIARPFDQPLPEPAVDDVHEITFNVRNLDEVRTRVSKHASADGLDRTRTEDLVLSVNELATNSLRYGGGRGLLRIWRENSTMLCEVRDAGLIDIPLVGRRRPNPGQEGGFGMWLVHQLCDLVQLRSFAEGSVVRLHMHIV